MQSLNTGFTFNFITRSNIYLNFHLAKKKVNTNWENWKIGFRPCAS